MHGDWPEIEWLDRPTQKCPPSLTGTIFQNLTPPWRIDESAAGIEVISIATRLARAPGFFVLSNEHPAKQGTASCPLRVAHPEGGPALKQISYATTLCLVLAVILLSSSMGAGVGCVSPGCRIESQNQIEWEKKPQIVDGYLEMRGKTKGDGLIHNADIPIGPRFLSAFDIYNYNEEAEDDPEYLERIGAIWPGSVRSDLLNRDASDLFAETYNVTSSSFDVRVKLPPLMLSEDVRLAVGVWEQHPDISLPLDREPLGGACTTE